MQAESQAYNYNPLNQVKNSVHMQNNVKENV